MSIYFQTRIRGEGKPIPEVLQAHSSLGVAVHGWAGNRVIVSSEEGQTLWNLSRNAAPTASAWHPTKKLVVNGWKDGMVSMWSADEPQSYKTVSNGTHHDNLSVLTMTWSSGGLYLLTTSKSNAVVVWQLESNNKLSMLWAVKSELPVVQAVHLQSPATKRISGAEASDDDILFAVSSGQNHVSLLDDTQALSPLVSLERDQQISSMLWDVESRNLVTLTTSVMIAVHRVDRDLKVSTSLRRKISVPVRGAEDAPFTPKMIWAAPGVVGLCCGDDKLRMFSVSAEVIYLVTSQESSQSITCIASQPQRKLLVCGTSDGATLLFRFNGKPNSQDADDWMLLATYRELGKPLEAIHLLASGDVVYTQDTAVVTLQETQRKRKWTGQASAFQTSPDQVLVETPQGGRVLVRIPSHVRDLDLCFPQLAVWTGSSIGVYSINESTGTYSALNAVDSASNCFGLHQDGILRVKDGKLVFDNFQLQSIASLAFSDAEGIPVLIDVQGDFVCCVTSNRMIRVVRVNKGELRSIGPSRPIFVSEPDVTVVKARINAVGKRVALLTNVTPAGSAAKVPDSRLWVFEVDTDRMTFHDFHTSHVGIPMHVGWNTPAPNVNTVGELEHLLLACEVKSSVAGGKSKTAGAGNPDASVNADVDASALDTTRTAEDVDQDAATQFMVTLFATPGNVVLHHSAPLKHTMSFLGITVPNLYVSTSKVVENELQYYLDHRRLRDFQGLGADPDPRVREALMLFGYNTTIGNMDEAYRAVKTIKDPSVWQNLAKMCVTTKRLDVAGVCLANMQDGVAARALRESKDEPELDTRLGILALSLGMREEAERFFKKAKRHDLVTELLIANGNWDAAQKNAEQLDRIRLRQVAYRYGQWMENVNDFNASVASFQKAGCMGTDVPRLFFLHGRLDELRGLANGGDAGACGLKTLDESAIKDLLVWWGNFEERNGNVAESLKCYERAGDVYNTVRLLTIQSPPQLDRAVDVVMKAPEKSQGAAYFIGLYYEQQNVVSKALQFYSMAGASRRAIQLAKTHELYGEVVGIVLKCDDKQLALECAMWFESRSVFDKAVQLYQKGGDVQRAIDVCIRGGLYDILNQISETLDQGADPDTFIQMAEHFLNSAHFDKAAQMLVFAKAYNEALQLCVDKNVKLTDEMAEAMTIPKSDNDDDEAYRISMLKKIAKVAKEQESWHLACKKYTQAGERVKAMKMLLRAGDTEKVMFFANHSRSTEIFILAGNYLQSQDWQHDANIYKCIVNFYTKAKAFENLASFYDACSQLQVDEYRNYDNALVTLREALKALEKGDASISKRNHFAQRIEIAEQFVNARKMIQPGKPSLEMVQICTDLITRSRQDHADHDLIEASIRVGDVFALLVEYYDKLGQVENAYSLMDRMRQQNIELTFFLEQSLIERICKACGRDAKVMLAMAQPQSSTHNASRPPAPTDENFEEEDI
jgi:intraflagellar transport protein 140